MTYKTTVLMVKRNKGSSVSHLYGKSQQIKLIIFTKSMIYNSKRLGKNLPEISIETNP